MRLKGAEAAAYRRNVLSQLTRHRRGRHVGKKYEPIVSQLKELSVKAAAAELERRTLAWLVFQLGDYASFTAKDLASFCSVEEAAAVAFLQGSHLDFGSLPPWTPGWELETIRNRPFMRDSAGRYLFASLQSPLWIIRPQIETALKQAGGRAWSKYEKHRGEYLEEAAVEALRSILDASVSYAGIKYDMESDGKRQRFELDGLLLRESTLFLVETKAGALHPSAWRGGADRLERQLGQLITEATDQAGRAKRALVDGEALAVLDRGGKKGAA